MSAANENKKSIVDLFMEGCRKGFNIGVSNILPAMVLGYSLILFLQTTGLMDIVSDVCAPVMGLFGVSGAGIVVLIAAFFAKASGCATAAMLVAEGTLTLNEGMILFPACILMGTLIGHYARIVLVSGANKKHHPLLFAVPLIAAAVSMIIMRVIMSFIG